MEVTLDGEGFFLEDFNEIGNGFPSPIPEKETDALSKRVGFLAKKKIPASFSKAESASVKNATHSKTQAKNSFYSSAACSKLPIAKGSLQEGILHTVFLVVTAVCTAFLVYGLTGSGAAFGLTGVFVIGALALYEKKKNRSTYSLGKPGKAFSFLFYPKKENIKESPKYFAPFDPPTFTRFFSASSLFPENFSTEVGKNTANKKKSSLDCVNADICKSSLLYRGACFVNDIYSGFEGYYKFSIEKGWQISLGSFESPFLEVFDYSSLCKCRHAPLKPVFVAESLARKIGQILKNLRLEEARKTYFYGINGIFTSIEDVREYKRWFQEEANIEIQWFYNESKGLLDTVYDLAFRDFPGKLAEVGADLIAELKQFYLDTFFLPDAKCVIIAHSQGALILGEVLRNLPKEIRDKVFVVAVAPPVPIYEGACKEAVNFVSRDVVPYAQGLLRWTSYLTEERWQHYKLHHEEKTAHIVYLTPHEDAPLMDHYFLSRTYVEPIKEILRLYSALSLDPT